VIPVVDLRSEQAVASLRSACEEIGFFTVVGHDVSQAAIDEVAAVSRRFFDQTEEAKVRFAGPGSILGLPVYRPLRSERLGATGDGEDHADLKESLDWGPELPGVGWPERPAALRRAWEAYYAAMVALAETLVRALALALELPEDTFVPYFDERSSSMRVINYPAPDAEPAPGQLRAGAHRDYGCLTILRIENAPGGLQVPLAAGTWTDVTPANDAYVVNIGDLMARWTNGRWVSTLHRVAWPSSEARSESRRQSLVFFHNPRADAIIEAIPGVGGEAKYEPVSAGDYILSKARAAFKA
jgi:isopenicillin N synthase-like dioxygenase